MSPDAVASTRPADDSEAPSDTISTPSTALALILPPAAAVTSEPLSRLTDDAPMRIDSSAVIDSPRALTDASSVEWIPKAPDDTRSKSPVCTSRESDEDTDTTPLSMLALSDENIDRVLPALTSTASVDRVMDSPA